MSTTDKPAHRPAADPAAPRSAVLSFGVSPADKAAYDALSAEQRAQVREALVAALRVALER